VLLDHTNASLAFVARFNDTSADLERVDPKYGPASANALVFGPFVICPVLYWLLIQWGQGIKPTGGTNPSPRIKIPAQVTLILNRCVRLLKAKKPICGIVFLVCLLHPQY